MKNLFKYKASFISQPKVLILYKKSLFEIYCKKHSDTANKFTRSRFKILKKVHDKHYQTLELVQCVLNQYSVPFVVRVRSSRIDYTKFNTIITVGGDGTFLEAAKKVTNQLMIGVNSAPDFSVGKFCAANPNNFEKIINQFVNNKILIIKLLRGRIKFNSTGKVVDFLNDILICHCNPAAMSRYFIQIDGKAEEQKSSGIWIATPSGSSGAIHSAGGKIIRSSQVNLQYLVREPYQYKKVYRVLKGFIFKDKKVKIQSYIRQGMIFVDGAHQKYPFTLCDIVKISISPHSIKTVGLI